MNMKYISIITGIFFAVLQAYIVYYFCAHTELIPTGIVENIIYNEEPANAIIIAMAATLVTFYVFASTIISLIFQLTFSDFHLFIEDLKNDKFFHGANFYYILSLLLCFILTAFVSYIPELSDEKTKQDIILMNLKAKNQILVISSLLIAFSSVLVLIFYIRRVIKYFGFTALIEITHLKIKSYVEEKQKESKQTIFSIDKLFNHSMKDKEKQLKSKEKEEIFITYQHVNSSLYDYLKIIEDITVVSPYVRRSYKVIDVFKDLILLGVRLNQDGVLDKDIKDQDCNFFEEEWNIQQIRYYLENDTDYDELLENLKNLKDFNLSIKTAKSKDEKEKLIQDFQKDFSNQKDKFNVIAICIESDKNKEGKQNSMDWILVGFDDTATLIEVPLDNESELVNELSKPPEERNEKQIVQLSTKEIDYTKLKSFLYENYINRHQKFKKREILKSQDIYSKFVDNLKIWKNQENQENQEKKKMEK